MTIDSSRLSQLLSSIRRTPDFNSTIGLKPVLFVVSGSQLFGTTIAASDLDCDGIFVPDFDEIQKLLVNFSPMTRLYLREAEISGLTSDELKNIEALTHTPETQRRILRDLLLEVRSKSFTQAELLELAEDRDAISGLPSNAVDFQIHPPVALARQISGEELPSVRTQMLLLALLCEDGEVLGANAEKTEAFRRSLRTAIFENRSFYFEVNRYWDLWWRYISHPTGGLHPKKIESATDQEFAVRDKMLYDLVVTADAHPKVGYDIKRSALLLTTVQAWNEFYENGATRGWRKSAIDTEFIRSVREGHVDYVTYASYRNRELDKIHSHSTRFQSLRLGVLCATDVLEELARLPALL